MSIQAVEQAIWGVRQQLEDYPQSAFVDEGGWRYLEIATRYALIDPMLTKLGWNLARPDQCSFEADPRWIDWAKPHVDYVFWRETENDRAAIVVEAKSADKRLDTWQNQSQLSRYIEPIQSGEAVLTNGREWYLYRINRSSDVGNKRPVRLNLLDGDARQMARILHERLDAGNWWTDQRCFRCGYHRTKFGIQTN